jgi:dihydropyrimidinase
MTAFDLVNRNSTAITATNTMRCDIAIRHGRVAALGGHLATGAQEIDAAGHL